MPLKIPPFTPVQIQPTSAEPFSTFVNNTPLAQTPLTGTELIPVIQGGVSKHTPPGSIGGGLTVGSTTVASGTSGFALTDNAGVLGDTPVRIVLTANGNRYISPTGSDSHDGLTLGTAWATTQHAANTLNATLDYAGFSINVNIAAGTYTQSVFVGGAVGNGKLLFLGAGSGSTTFQDDGVTGVGIFGFSGEGLSCSVDAMTIQFGASGIGVQGVGYIGNQNTFTQDIVWSWDGVHTVFGNGIQQVGVLSVVGGPDATKGNQIGTMTINNFYFANTNGIIFNYSFLNIVGALTINAGGVNGFLQLSTNGFYFEFGNNYSLGPRGAGSVTGPRLAVSGGSGTGLFGGAAGSLGTTWFPGNSFGTVDSSSYYDGFIGPFPGINTQTANYTLALSDEQYIVEMNLAGANTVTVDTNANQPFEIGTRIWVTQTGAGATTIAAAGGVTVHNAGAVGGQWKSVKLYKRGTDEWVQTNT